MLTLIPEFARVMTESNRRAANSVDEEAQRVEKLRERAQHFPERNTGWDAIRQRAARQARAATQELIAEAHEVKDLWSSALESLRKGLPPGEQLEILQVIADLAASGRDFREPLGLWDQVERLGGEVEGTGELTDAACLLDEVYSEAIRALEFRNAAWQPSDPARLEQGRQEIREGKAVGPDEARSRFRKKQG